jgi:alpha/beta superfamily hydrolase
MNPEGPFDPNSVPPSPLPGSEQGNPYGYGPQSDPYGNSQPYQPDSQGYVVNSYPERVNDKLIMGLGVASIFLFQLILGPIAWILGTNAIRTIGAGRADPTGYSSANAGRIFGALGSAIGVVLIVILFNMSSILSKLDAGDARVGSTVQSVNLAQGRTGFQTQLTAHNQTHDPLPDPPAGFTLVNYPAPLGEFPAIIADPVGTPAVSTNGKYPVVIWITGGFSNEIGDNAWSPATPDNDQTGSAFRLAGVKTMYPSLRGGNNNPGYLETEYGEVDDVLAAARWLMSRPDVDPTRIYLAGHSTGGTLALLTAESSGIFRAVFSFGPVDDVSRYGSDNATFDLTNQKEVDLRAPIEWMGAVATPTFVIEGDGTAGNISSLRAMRGKSSNSNLHFVEVAGYDHFSELAHTTPVIAKKIAADNGATCNITLTESDWPGN